MSNDEDYGEEKTQISMTNLFYLRIHKILMKADECSFDKDLEGWMRALSVLYRNIKPVVHKAKDRNNKQIESVENALKEASMLIYENIRVNNKLGLEKKNNNYCGAYEKLDFAHLNIVMLMHGKGLLLPQIKMRGEQRLRQAFGID